MSAATCVLAAADTLPRVTAVAGSGADPSCQVSEVTRLLWTMVAVAAATGLVAVVRPSWRWVIGLTGASVLWAWIDMEGPVLVSRGTHGLHVADLPVVISTVAVAVVAIRLWRRRPTRRVGPD